MKWQCNLQMFFYIRILYQKADTIFLLHGSFELKSIQGAGDAEWIKSNTLCFSQELAITFRTEIVYARCTAYGPQ